MFRLLPVSPWIAAFAGLALAAFAPLSAGARQVSGAPDEPVRIYGNTFYVGTRALSSVLVTSPDGHVLIDSGYADSARVIADHIRKAGFRIEDVKLILNSHAHSDHAGGLAELQRLSGATVAVSQPSAAILGSGRSGTDDPQYGISPPIAPVRAPRIVRDGETMRVGALALTAHATGGHTPGGTSWTWRSCLDARCVDIVYADSLTAVSADGFLFTRNTTYPNVLADFEKSFATLSTLPCGILLTPHPGVSGFWDRLSRRTSGQTAEVDPVVDPDACRRYVESARRGLAARVAREKTAQTVR